MLYKADFVFLERKVCHVYMQFEPKLAKPYVMCICSLSPSLLSPKSIKLIKTQVHQVHKFIKLKLIKFNEDSSPIPSRPSHLPLGLGLSRSNFHNFNSNIHNRPRRNKQLDFTSFHKQSSHIWVFRIIVHLNFFFNYMFQLEIFVEV